MAFNRSVFDVIDEAAEQTKNPGNFLLFIASCAGISGKADISKLSGLKTLATSREGASLKEINTELENIGIVEQWLSDYFGTACDISWFDGCQSSKEFFTIAKAPLRYSSAPILDTRSSGLSDSWMLDSGACTTEVQLDFPNQVFYDDEKLQVSTRYKLVSSEGIKFFCICNGEEYKEIVKCITQDKVKRVLEALPEITSFDLPLVIGMDWNKKASYTVTSGKAKAKIMVSETKIDNVRVAKKDMRDAVSGLRYRVLVLGG